MSRAGTKCSRLWKRQSRVSVFTIGARFSPDQDGECVCERIARRHSQPRVGLFTFFIRQGASETKWPRKHGQPPPPTLKARCRGCTRCCWLCDYRPRCASAHLCKGRAAPNSWLERKLGGLVPDVGTPSIRPCRAELDSD